MQEMTVFLTYIIQHAVFMRGSCGTITRMAHDIFHYFCAQQIVNILNFYNIYIISTIVVLLRLFLQIFRVLATHI